MRAVYFESLGKRAFDRLGPIAAGAIEKGSPEFRTFVRDLPAADLAYMRPTATLPVSFASFDEQGKIDAFFAIGNADSERPFTPYTWEQFRL